MKRRLKLFLGFWTLLIAAYALIFVVLNDETVRSLHEEVPPLQYVGVTLGLFDNTYLYDDEYQIKKRVQSNLQEYFAWKQSKGEDTTGTVYIYLDEDFSKKRLYSPIYKFAGEASKGITKITVTLSHKGRELVRSRITKPSSDGRWEYEVSLPNEMMFAGENVYLIEAEDVDGKIVSKKVTLTVDFKRIEVGESVLYIDPQYIPEGADEDIMRSTVDMKQQEVTFITHGCDEAVPQQSILLEHAFQFSEVPACLTFSLVENYMLWFESLGKQGGDYMFSIHSPDEGLVMDTFPLYRQYLGNIYYTLVFWEKAQSRLATLYAQGNAEQYILRIERVDTVIKNKELEIVVTDGNQLIVQNKRQKMYMYLYKERDKKKALSFPGNRYVYRQKNLAGNRVVINQGAMHSPPVRVHAPRKPAGSTFTFGVTLDDDILYIDDGLKVVQFDVNSMGTTIGVSDSLMSFDDPSQCRSLSTAIHENFIGDAPLKYSIYDYPVIVGEGRDFSSVQVFHNGKSTGAYVDQLYKGYFYHRLGKERRNVVPGENIYTIKSYDQRGNQLCSETVRLTTQ